VTLAVGSGRFQVRQQSHTYAGSEILVLAIQRPGDQVVTYLSSIILGAKSMAVIASEHLMVAQQVQPLSALCHIFI
jgi:hypothetical protein